MSERNNLHKKASFVLYLVLFFCVINLMLTASLLIRSFCENRQVGAITGESLPAGLQSVEERMEIFNRLSAVYNAGEAKDMMEMLDPLARVQITNEQMIERMDSLQSLIGKILDGAYSHYEVAGSSEGLEMFRLHYVLQVEKGKANMWLTLGQQGEEPYRFLGFHINKAE